MKKIIFTTLASLASFATIAQTVSNFENFTLGPTGFNCGFGPVTAVTKFTSGNATFVNFYDTSFGGYWAGCAISNIKDSINGSFGNQFASVAYGGYGGSSNYATIYVDYNPENNKIILEGPARGKVVAGTYITNSTWAYAEMKDGSPFSKKFGGITGNDPDYYYVTFTGWYNGNKVPNKVDFYLADYRNSNNANDYIVKNWRWVDLSSLGNLDSLTFDVSSSDTGQFGINTPKYFCIDNFTTTDAPLSIGNTTEPSKLSLYPNPAQDYIFINTQKEEKILIVDHIGNVVRDVIIDPQNNRVVISDLPPGNYFIKSLSGMGSFIKR